MKSPVTYMYVILLDWKWLFLAFLWRKLPPICGFFFFIPPPNIFVSDEHCFRQAEMRFTPTPPSPRSLTIYSLQTYFHFYKLFSVMEIYLKFFFLTCFFELWGLVIKAKKLIYFCFLKQTTNWPLRKKIIFVSWVFIMHSFFEPRKCKRYKSYIYTAKWQ